MKIVLVDDDCAFERSLDIVLSARGHQVLAFSKPLEGCLSIASKEVDILILDYAMPEMNGFQFLNFVKEFLPSQCKVVFVSGHEESIDMERLKETGACAFFPKPLDLKALIRLIESEPSDDNISVEEVS